MNFRLSIITINLNNELGLQKTIQSVVSQSFKNFEYIIIDGKSSDNSINIIKTYKNKINYWISEPDKGIYNAMNKGILKANGEYCLFLNSGDYLYDNCVLEKIFSYDPIDDIIYCNSNDLKKHNKTNPNPPEKLTFYKFFLSTPICHQATLIKRELFHKIGLYNEHNKYASDWEFFMVALARHNATYKYHNLVLCEYDITGISSREENQTEMLQERESVLKRQFPLFYDDYK
jgi:glycosyltransferase involved in cell wall biosynthesis